MRIKSISCHNLKAFADLSIELGDICIFSGSNGTGKTSALTILTAAFGAASSRMLRAGADSGDVVIEIEEDDETFIVRRAFTATKVDSPTVKSSKAGRLGAPASWLKQILDRVSMDPLRA